MKKIDLINLTSNINRNSCPNDVNFHCHTTFSDGSMEPIELLEKAILNNLRYISITDHHTINAYKYLKEKKILKKLEENSTKLVTGIEINCLLKGCLVHIIGLGIDIDAKSLRPYINGESAIGNDLTACAVIKSIKEANQVNRSHEIYT